MSEVRIHDNFGTRMVPITDRKPIVECVMRESSAGMGGYGMSEEAILRNKIEHLESVLTAVLMGCSVKNFRQTLIHFGLTVTNGD